MDKNITQNNQTKTQLSLAALMFFSPLVQNILNKSNFQLSTDDKTFIQGYIRLGYLSLTILAITIASGLVNYRLPGNGIFERGYTISIIILIIILAIGTMGILTNTNILAGSKEFLNLYQGEATIDKKNILLAYLPVYNIYLRYQEHNFDSSGTGKPNLLIKESIIAWLIFCIFGIFTTPFWTSVILMIIIVRIASLMGGIDLINPQIKNFINNLFTKNPEELRGRITKQDFSLLYNIQLHNSILLKTQYALAIITIIILYYKNILIFGTRNSILPRLIIAGRYLVMLIKRNHLPSIPIFKEITDLGYSLYQKISNHFINR